MKITFPYEKRKIILTNDERAFYVIVGHGRSKGWWLQNFWDLPFMFRTYKEAKIGAKDISRKMKHYKWEDSKAVIAKITL